MNVIVPDCPPSLELSSWISDNGWFRYVADNREGVSGRESTAADGGILAAVAYGTSSSYQRLIATRLTVSRHPWNRQHALCGVRLCPG